MEMGSMGQTRFRRFAKARLRYHRLSRMREKMRIASNIGLIIGQCILLFVDRDWGLRFIIASSLLSFPYFWHHKMWDVVALMVFLNVVNVVGLFVQ
jgi:hypothetical protein